MEVMLKGLFDYQRFEEHPGLRSLIDSVHSRCAAHSLSMEDLDYVSAAGSPDSIHKKEES